jgi:hypothetical protein
MPGAIVQHEGMDLSPDLVFPGLESPCQDASSAFASLREPPHCLVYQT